MTADFHKQELLVEQLGSTPGKVAGKSLEKGESVLLGPMGCLELLDGKHKYHVHFGKRVPKDVLQQLQEDADNTSEEEESAVSVKGDSEVVQKRKRVRGNKDNEEVVLSKKPRVEVEPGPSSVSTRRTRSIKPVTTELPQSKSKQGSLDKFLPPQSTTTNDASGSFTHEWKEVGDTLLVLQYGPQLHSRKVASFDLDGTLIDTASGRR